MTVGLFFLLVFCSAGAVLLGETALAFLGIGGSARYERLTGVLSSRVELLIEEVERLRSQIETTRRDAYPRLEAVDRRLAAIERKDDPKAAAS